MKLSKQERIGALIILAAVIIALGVFLLIKPKIEEIGSTQKTLTTKQDELKRHRETQQRKDPLRTEIEAAYQEGEHLADMFFPEFTSYEADDAFREFIRQCKVPVVVEEINVSNPTTSSLSVSFFTPSEVNYALKSYVSQGVEYSETDEVNARRIAALQSALSGSQTIGASNVTFTVSALSQDDIIKFVDEINNYFIKDEGTEGDGIRKAVRINSLSVPYAELNYIYDAYVSNSTEAMIALGETARSEIAAKKENPNASQAVGEATSPDAPTYDAYEDTLPYTYSDTITFYSIERMQNPKKILDEQDGIFEEPAPGA